MAYEFRFPDIGEGITEGELLSWKVKEGEHVAQDQTLAEMETDKAVVEMPSPRPGRIARLHAAEGDIVNVGDILVTIEEGAEPAAAPAGAPAGVAAATAAPPAPAPPAAPAGVPPAAVAPPPSAAPAGATPPPPAAPAAAPPEPVSRVAPSTAPPEPEAVPYTGSVVGQLEEAPEDEEEGQILAMPSVRALARQLGVDLRGLRGTGPGGRILKQDVEDMAQSVAYGAAVPRPAAPAGAPIAGVIAGAADAPAAPARAEQPALAQAPEVPAAVPETGAIPPAEEPPCDEEVAVCPLLGGVIENDGHGPVERVLFRGVRRSMARHMAEAVAKQAQVTTMDEADVTIIKRIREKERTLAAERGVRLTYLAFVVKACTASLKRFPRLNAVLEESGDEFLLKRYYNIGIAVDTRSGLMVPNIKDADRKSIFRIAEEIVDLVDRAEERQIDLQGFRGGTFTITNYGAIGGLYATPVINYPEVAILGMGRVKETPALREGKMITRLMLPLALTFDHRLVDGAEAARFLNLVIGYLEDPDLLLLEGA